MPLSAAIQQPAGAFLIDRYQQCTRLLRFMIHSLLRFVDEHTFAWYALCVATGLLVRLAMVHGDLALFFSIRFFPL